MYVLKERAGDNEPREVFRGSYEDCSARMMELVKEQQKPRESEIKLGEGYYARIELETLESYNLRIVWEDEHND